MIDAISAVQNDIDRPSFSCFMVLKSALLMRDTIWGLTVEEITEDRRLRGSTVYSKTLKTRETEAIGLRVYAYI